MLIVISQDALVYEDLAYLEKLPNYRRLMSSCAQIKRLRTIYPTVTYPVHTSISTGVYADRHGITTNEIFRPGTLGNPWHWFAEDVKAPTIFEYAKRAGLSTAAVFWPVTGNNPYIDYLVDEYWTQGADDTCEAAFARSGSSPDVMEHIVEPNLHLLRGHERQHPAADSFVTACACDIIRRYKPDLLMVHPAHIDGFRHQYGLFNEQINRSLDVTDEQLGEVYKALEDAGELETANIVIMSDHGQITIQRSIALNVLLKEAGYIRTDESGRVVDWDAYVVSAGLSAQVYIRPAFREEIKALLDHWCYEGIYGISRVFTREECVKEERLGGDFDFVLETDGFTAFSENWERPLVRPIDISDWRYGHATHGYLPDKGPQPTFLASGPAFKAGAVVERLPIVDTTATFAKILGVHMDNIDGVSADMLLN